MKTLRLLRIAGQLLTIVGLAGVAVVAPNPVAELPVADAAKREKIEICHRTNSRKNPYRRIRVAFSSLQSGHSGHGSSDDVFNVSAWNHADNSDGWGDIYNTSGSPSRTKNWSAEGKAIFGIDSSGLRVTPATFSDGATTKQACRALTALQYIEAETAASADGGGGQTLANVMSDLNSQGADEDKAVLSRLGYSSWSAWYTAIGSPTSLSTANTNSLTSAQDSSPSATTSAATSVGRTSAVLNGSVA